MRSWNILFFGQSSFSSFCLSFPVRPFPHVDPRDWARVARLGGKPFAPYVVLWVFLLLSFPSLRPHRWFFSAFSPLIYLCIYHKSLQNRFWLLTGIRRIWFMIFQMISKSFQHHLFNIPSLNNPSFKKKKQNVTISLPGSVLYVFVLRANLQMACHRFLVSVLCPQTEFYWFSQLCLTLKPLDPTPHHFL